MKNFKIKKFLKASIIPILLFFIIISGYIYNKYIRKFVLPCLFQALTGYYCIGCGGTRSFYSLIHGNILLSIKYNPIVPFGILFLILKWIEILSHKKIIPSNGIFWCTVSGIFVLFYIARNFINYNL